MSAKLAEVDPSTLDDPEAVVDALRTATDAGTKLQLALKLAEFEPDAARPVISMLDASAVDTKAVIELRLGTRSFPPAIAYAIFPADLVRGYEAPKLLIEFDPVCLLPFVHFEAKQKVDSTAPDAVDLLREFMPSDTVYEDRKKWDEQRRAERQRLPFGNKSSAFTVNGEYEVWRIKSGDSDSAETAFLRRMFVFSWFFIEGARTPDESDSTWDFYIVTKRGSVEFVGYVSVYAFLYYGSGAQFEAEGGQGRCTRRRIAHFVLLPPFQRQGLGSAVYLELLKFFVRDPLVKEVEVEDPSTPFEMLRDRTHWQWLSSDPSAVALLDEYDAAPEATLGRLVEQYKLAPIQLQRVAEMYIYKDAGFKETRGLRQLIKARLWARNYEALRDMDPATQRDRLHDAFEGVVRTHRRALGLDADNESDASEEEADDAVDALLAGIAASRGGPAAKKRREE